MSGSAFVLPLGLDLASHQLPRLFLGDNELLETPVHLARNIFQNILLLAFEKRPVVAARDLIGRGRRGFNGPGRNNLEVPTHEGRGGQNMGPSTIA